MINQTRKLIALLVTLICLPLVFAASYYSLYYTLTFCERKMADLKTQGLEEIVDGSALVGFKHEYTKQNKIRSLIDICDLGDSPVVNSPEWQNMSADEKMKALKEDALDELHKQNLKKGDYWYYYELKKKHRAKRTPSVIFAALLTLCGLLFAVKRFRYIGIKAK